MRNGLNSLFRIRKKKISEKPEIVKDINHGTQYSYYRKRCRCVKCCEAYRKALEKQRIRQRIGNKIKKVKDDSTSSTLRRIYEETTR